MAHKIGTNIALLWSGLLPYIHVPCPLRIQERLIGSGPNMGPGTLIVSPFVLHFNSKCGGTKRRGAQNRWLFVLFWGGWGWGGGFGSSLGYPAPLESGDA